MKKILSLAFMCAALSFGVLAGCGSDATTPAPSTGDETATGLKIAIVSSPSGVDDGSFNEDNYNGILSFIENHPEATVTAVNEPTGGAVESVQAVADIVADYDVIVTPGFQFAGISTLALENPDKEFILVDSFPTEVEGQAEFENIYAMTFAEQESGFLTGIAAAQESVTGKVAVVNGVAFPSNVNYQYGFESGVEYANQTLGLEVECVELPSYAGVDVTGANVGGNYVGNFADQATGKVIGNALIAEGVDVILVAAGGSGNGVFTAAKEAEGVKVIGCDVDQYADGVNGDSNIMLTSALKVMSINVERALEAIEADTFEGGNVLLGADTDSTGYVKEEGHHQLSENTIVNIDAAYKKMATGEIVPAANFNGVTPENFPGLPSYAE